MSTDNKKLSVWVMNSKGGVGKTTLSVALADQFLLAGRPLSMLEIDTRKRLSSFMGTDNVISFDGAPPIAEIRRNPNLILRHYDPIISAIEAGDTLIDLGANEDPAFLEYCKLSRLEEDLEDMDVEVMAFVPTVAETESIKGAMVALDTLKDVVPSSRRVLVMNERDPGDFEKYLSVGEQNELRADGVTIVTMPKIVSEGWEDFQRAKMRFIDIIGMDTAAIQAKFNYVRPMAKRSRGDVAFWFERMRVETLDLIPRVG